MPKPTARKIVERKPASRDLVPPKLTEAQRIVLSHAARRDDGAATLPERMTERAAQKLAVILIENGLVREMRAKTGMPVWRRNEDERVCTLVITKLGKEAVKGGGDRQSADADVETAPLVSTASAAPSQTATSSRTELSVPRQGSKIAEVMALLGRKQGVGIEALTKATGWLPHTTRAALTGLRKRGLPFAENLALCRELLDVSSPPKSPDAMSHADQAKAPVEPPPCPCCGGRMRIVETFDGAYSRSHPVRGFNSS